LIKYSNLGYEIDFGAEPLIAAEKDEFLIAIEVKSFVGPSTVNEFHKAVGQFNDYSAALEIQEPDRMLFLAIPEEIGFAFFRKRSFNVRWSVSEQKFWSIILNQTPLYNG